MRTKLIARAALALLLSAIAVPAFAQSALKGRVVNQQKRPVSEAQVTATCISVSNVQPQSTVTDTNGNFSIGGLQFGKWNVVITKGKTWFKNKKELNLMPGVVEDLGDVMLEPMPEGMAAAPASKSEADAANKKSAEIQAKVKAANDDIAAEKYDDALAKLDAVSKDVPKCATCSAMMGSAYLKKNDLANAEKSFLQAIEYDPNMVEAYNNLATVYNSQSKFDEALKMTAKARELSTAKGGSADPISTFNEGVVLWNAGKAAEAEPLFKKTTELDPKKAEAFFLLGMTQVNTGKLPEAVKSFETYLQLDPKGKDAEMAKNMLTAIKK